MQARLAAGIDMKSPLPHACDTSKISQGKQGAAKAVPRILITAGPTHEPIDPVRYIGNRSSGRMGIALAQAALRRDWPVTLLLGPVAINPPEHSQLRVQRFQTAADLQALLHQTWPTSDVLFMAAAVADFTVAKRNPVKIKRDTSHLTLELIPTPDLLASLSGLTRPHQMVVGFALEAPADLLARAQRKLTEKRLDAIVANPLETMDAAEVTATLLWSDGRLVASPAGIPKSAFADWLLDQVTPALEEKKDAAARKATRGGV
jgi:phosphopantothenoylcysteine decarboxylase/phosphopantothenate--cysteine ligase